MGRTAVQLVVQLFAAGAVRTGIQKCLPSTQSELSETIHLTFF